MRVSPDQLVVFRSLSRRGQREDRTAIGWSYGDPAAKLEARIGDNVESQLVDIKLQAAIVVANKDIRLEDSEIRILRRQFQRLLPGRAIHPKIVFRTQIDLPAWLNGCVSSCCRLGGLESHPS